VQLAFGELADGSIVHVSEVSSGIACSCICPGCKARLVAKKGVRNEHHFGHYRTALCKHALESALHKLAKQVLDEHRTLLLPKVKAELGERELVTYGEEMHQFEEALLEHNLDVIVPDVIVRKGRHRLLVEVFVTHRCGPEKIEKIRALGLSCLEVDLSRLPRDANREQIATALLGAAPRYWIHNPKINAAAQRLEMQIAQEREEARIASEHQRERERRKMERMVATLTKLRDGGPPGPNVDSKTVRTVCIHGFGHLIGHSQAGDFCFSVSAREWQAVIVKRFVVDVLERWGAISTSFHASDAFNAVKDAKLVRPEIPIFFEIEDAKSLVQQVPGFRTPYRVVESYLGLLQSDGVLRQECKRWAVSDQTKREWSDRKQRKGELSRSENLVRSMVLTIMSMVSEEDRAGFSLEHWWALAHPSIGISLADAFAEDDPRLPEVSLVVHQIESMFVRNGKIVDDLFNLPVEVAREQLVEARRSKAEEERRAALAKAQQERLDRVARLENEARVTLSDGATTWIDASSSSLQGASPRARAIESSDGLHASLRLLSTAGQERRAQLERERFKIRLLEIAKQARRPDHARVFLTSPNPAWRNRHPIDFCVDQSSFDQLCKAMAKVAG